MEPVISIKPLLAVLVSAAAVPLIAGTRNRNLREVWTFAAAGAKLALVLSMLPLVLGGGRLVFSVAEPLPGLALAFRVDAMGMLFALVSASLWIATSAYSIGYMRGLDEHGQTRIDATKAVVSAVPVHAGDRIIALGSEQQLRELEAFLEGRQ